FHRFRSVAQILKTVINVKIQCSCGQKFGFDVEPVNGRMPWQVNCPGCGADQTNEANEILARGAGAPALSLKLPAHAESPPSAPDRSLIGAHGTMASNPAKLRVNWARANATRPAPLVLG